MYVTYKKYYNGFHFDTVCDDGYALYYILNHYENNCAVYIDLSHLIQHALYLINQFTNKRNQIFMYDIFNYVKFALSAQDRKSIFYRVVCINNG